MNTPNGSSRVILLEFNELTPVLLDKFMARGYLPNFKRLHDESQVYVTDAQESGERLNPWIQWVTVHSGLTLDEHGVMQLDEGHKVKQPRLWDIFSANGDKVLVCGSMNVGYRKPLNGVVLPDPWSTTVDPYPADAGLDAYFRFVQSQVQEHTNESVPLEMSDYISFLRFMVGHGLSPHTVRTIMAQLVGEKFGVGKWKRAVILDKLQYDVFRSLYRRLNPRFSTFFLNSTAHMQHVYWRYMDPEPFSDKPSDEDRAEYGDAVLFGYRQMDGMIKRFIDLAGKDVTLVFTTAFGQQPYLDLEGKGGKRFYRPRDFKKLMAFVGITSKHKVSPVMSEQFHVYFDDPADAEVGLRMLSAVTMNGKPLMLARLSDGRDVFSGVQIFEAIPEGTMITNEAGESRPLYSLFYQAATVKSGRHHPDGAFWIRTPSRTHQRHEEKVPLASVAPTILSLSGLPVPEYMRSPAVSFGPAGAPVG